MISISNAAFVANSPEKEVISLDLSSFYALISQMLVWARASLKLAFKGIWKCLGISLENVMSSLLGKQNCEAVVLFLSEDEVERGLRGHFVTLIKVLKQLIQCSP